MGYKFNPFTGSLDTVDSPNGVFNEIDVSGDITLDDGGTYETTVQVVTPTANRTISFPDATGTVALVAGSTGQVTYNNAGAQAGLTSANIGSTGEINISLAGAASTPPVSFTGSWFTGGTATTTKPQLLIEPTGTTSTAWSTSGTGLGVNAASGFGGRLLDLQTNGTSRMVVQGDGKLGLGTSSPSALLHINENSSSAAGLRLQNTEGYHELRTNNDELTIVQGTSERARIDSSGRLLVGTSTSANTGESQYGKLQIKGNSSGSAGVGIVTILRDEAAATITDGEHIGRIVFGDSTGNQFAWVTATADGTAGTGDFPGRLVFSTTADGASTPTERMRIKAGGVINFSSCPTYADDAAAGTGGLVAGDIYKTSTGELRIKL
jgi:hypothetical protein